MQSFIPEKPLDRIALGLSGGGYRASSFHLGALSYLNRLQFYNQPLLENVVCLSSVSGGTITAVVYANMKADGKSFDEFYTFLLGCLKKYDLIKLGLKKLDFETDWNNPKKRKNLINSFAELYDQYLTQQATFNKLFSLSDVSHLKHVVFNSTEFNNGLNFRFQNTGTFGNFKVKIPKAVASEVKLGDVIAASSCFPGGFEPIGFPGDFGYEESQQLNDFKSGMTSDIGLMDGGIYDNQGIDSILTVQDRGTVEPFDLIIISDVSSPDIDQFEFYEKQKDNRLRNTRLNDKMNSYKWWGRWFPFFVLLPGILIFMISLFIGHNNGIKMFGIGAFSISFLYFIISLFLRYKFQNNLAESWKYLTDKIDPFFKSKVKSWDIENYKIGRLENLLFDRAFSLKSLVSEIFLKDIRKLHYQRVYANKDYEYRRISNLIKELTEKNFAQKHKNFGDRFPDCPDEMKGDYHAVVGNKIKELVEEAASFGTTLWFTEKDETSNILDKLISSGQVTMCYNILVYLIELRHASFYSELDQERRDEIDILFGQCLEDWRVFREDPRVLLGLGVV